MRYSADVAAAAGGTALSRLIRLDNLRFSANLGLQVAAQGLGSSTFTVEYSFDDPNDLINPVAPGAMQWFTDLSPFVNAAAPGSGAMPVSPAYLRLRLTGTAGAARLTATQYRHSIGGFGGKAKVAPVISLVQSAPVSQNSTAPGITTAFGKPIGVGNAVFVTMGSFGPPPTACTDDKGNVYTQVGQGVTTNGYTSTVYFAPNIINGPSTMMVTATSLGNQYLVAEEFVLSPAATIDTWGAGQGVVTGTSYDATGPITPAHNGDLIYAVAGIYNGGITGPGPGFNAGGYYGQNGPWGDFNWSEWLAQSAAQTVHGVFTCTSGSSAQYSAGIILAVTNPAV